MSEKKKSCDSNKKVEISSVPPCGAPETAFEMLTSYGTYEIQSTANTENIFPTVAQGIPKSRKRKSRK